jgi:two-component system copper resistance phosphate regulon response regulator CusR
MRILLIEDDTRLQALLREGFAERDVEVAFASTAREGREKANLAHWDVIVLDVGLPDEDGFTTCARLRASGVETPVLMLTARDRVTDRVHGLESGADDYLVKPFDFRELAARVSALARRPPVIAPEIHEVGDLRIDLRTREVTRAGVPIELTAKEFALLEVLVRDAGAVQDRAM